MRKYGDMTFQKFLVAGVLNTGVTYLLYLILLHFMPYILAYSLTYVVGIVLGYSLNAKWVFKKTINLRTAIVYPLSYGFNYIIGVSMLWVFVEILNFSREISPLVVVVISVPLMYFFTKIIFQGGLHNDTKTHNQ